MTHKVLRTLTIVGILVLLVSMMALPAFAAGKGDVSGAIKDTWDAAKTQVKDIVNNVVFPVIDLVMAVLFFAKVSTCNMDYRKHGTLTKLP